MKRKHRLLRLMVLVLLLVATLPGGAMAKPTAAPELQGKITFEEAIPQPGRVLSQYCNNAATNKGVEFLNHGGRIFTPTQTTSSPTHALTNNFPGDEFGEFKRLQIRFTTGQSEVSLQAGLERSYNFGVTAHMYAYSGTSPGGTAVTTDHVQLGTGPTQVLHEVKVTSASANIRSVELFFTGPSPGNETHEVIDDLTYSTVGPPCISDTAAPTVQITKPSTDGTSTQNPYQELAFTATDSQSGIAKIQVQFLDGTGTEISSFTVCGGTGPVCLYDVFPTKASYDFHTTLADGTKRIRVKAWDFAGHVGQADRTISVTAIGYFNLWAEAMEITQATQPWLPINYQATKSGAAPSYAYPGAPTAVPLVANRTTVVRLFGNVAGTVGGQALNNVWAQLRCYTDASYTTSCPGQQALFPHNQPPNILKVITVSPSNTLDERRRDSRLSWNFILPSSWTSAGTVYLEARVRAPTGLQECAGCDDAANRFRITSVQFNTVPNFQDKLVHLVKTKRTLDGVTYEPTQAHMDNAVEWLSKMYPVDESTMPTTSHATWTLDDCGDTCDPDPKKNLSVRCGRVTGLLAKDYPDKAGKKAVYAILDADYDCAGMGGGGYAFGHANRPDSFPHEVGHAVDLPHAGPPPGHRSECDPWACDADWPYPHGRIGAFGFNVLTMEVIPEDRLPCHTAGVCDNGINEDNDKYKNGSDIIDEECVGFPDPDPPADLANDPHDIMSYGPCTKWISPRNWIRIYNAFTGSNLDYPKNPTAAAEPDGVDLSSGAAEPAEAEQFEPHFIISGLQVELDVWLLEPVYEMDLPLDPTYEPGEGEYSVVLVDATGEETILRSFDIPVGHVDMDDPGGTLAVDPSFAFNDPIPLPDPADVEAILLRQGDERLAEIRRSLHAPTVLVTSPTEGGFLVHETIPYVTWEASDEDGDDLRFMVQYSPPPWNGHRQWQTLAVDWTDEMLPVNLADLPGGQGTQVRVLATDGLNTTAAVSPLFAVDRKPPVPLILTPDDDLIIGEGDRLVLVAAASDLEDGLLDPEALRWYADLYIPLGLGPRLDVDTLPAGDHLITLLAEDSDGMAALDHITVIVEARINGQPTADAGPDRTAGVFDNVRLDGSGSSDPDGDTLTFNWQLVSWPPNASTALNWPTTVHPVLVADTEGDYEVVLTVHDGQVSSVAGSVIIHIAGPGTTTITLDPVESMVPVSDTVTVEVRIDNIEDLYGAQVSMAFNPDLVEVVDAYDFLPGVQLEEGDFPVPETIIRNQVDNTTGLIEYAVSLQGAQPGVSGSGTLARITFHGRQPGESQLEFTDVVLSDPQSKPIEAIPEGSIVLVREASATVLGWVILERRDSNEGAIVCVDDICTRTAQDGWFILPDVPPGPHPVTLGHEGYLRTWREADIPEGLLVLPEVTLLGGDVDGDDLIGEFDGIATGLAWNTTPMDENWNGSADITDDSMVDILDMVAVQFNWRQMAPGPWNTALAQRRLAPPLRQLSRTDLATQVVISPTQAMLSAVGETVDLDIRILDVINLYGGWVQLTFDPTVIQVRDADPRPSAPGVQIRPGDFLDPSNQFVLVNEADNTAGTIDFAVTQLHPAEARGGSGVLATVQFEAVGQGSSSVHLVSVRLGDDTRPDPAEIPAGTQYGQVTVGAQHTLYLPIGLKSTTQ